MTFCVQNIDIRPCYSRKKGSTVNNYPYYICSTKKKKGKRECDNNNVQVRKIDSFIDDLCKTYYRNIRLRNKVKLYQLQSKLKKQKEKSVVDLNNEILGLRNKINDSEDQLSKLIDNFLECSDVMRKVIDKKIKDLEIIIENYNNRILELERSKENIDSYKITLERQIKEVKKELKTLDTTELTREELMEKIRFIKVDKGNKFIVEYH